MDTIKENKKAIKKLRLLLFRLWFVKNWFTILTLILILLLTATVTGLIPQDMPLIGEFSHALKIRFQAFLEIDDDTFYSLFGSFTGIASILFGLGYTTSKVKMVTYAMIKKDKLRKALRHSRLSINEKGHIVSLEKEVGIDLDGDKRVGEVPKTIVDSNNFIGEIIDTANELLTINNISDETLQKIIDETEAAKKEVFVEENKEVIEVSQKKPASAYNKTRKY